MLIMLKIMPNYAYAFRCYYAQNYAEHKAPGPILMSLEEFKAYVTNSGVTFDTLSTAEKREWRETFDKSRQGKPPPPSALFLLISPPL